LAAGLREHGWVQHGADDGYVLLQLPGTFYTRAPSSSGSWGSMVATR
jgi:hypothetical protein